MKQLSPTRAVFRRLASIANDGTTIVCLCKTERHIKAFTGAIIMAVFELHFLPWAVAPADPTTIVTVGHGQIILLPTESYDSGNFILEHKTVEFTS